MPVVVAWAAGPVVEGEKEWRKWLVVSVLGSRVGVLNAWIWSTSGVGMKLVFQIGNSLKDTPFSLSQRHA